MHALARAGGGGNVTVPHKESAALALGHRDGLVDAVGACNTFWLRGDRLVGDNTDVDGLLARARYRSSRPDGPWLIAGTGGSARAGGDRRRPARGGCRGRFPLGYRGAGRFEVWARRSGAEIVPTAECRVMINATPLGLSPGDAQPPEQARSPPTRPSHSTWCTLPGRPPGCGRCARAAFGPPTVVRCWCARAPLAFERWFPGADAPTEVMRAAVDAALR